VSTVIDELHEYQHIFKRLEKLHKSIRHTAQENAGLRTANQKLRAENASLTAHVAAQERVLRGLQAKINVSSE
jgi:hypothetical protein